MFDFSLSRIAYGPSCLDPPGMMGVFSAGLVAKEVGARGLGYWPGWMMLG